MVPHPQTRLCTGILLINFGAALAYMPHLPRPNMHRRSASNTAATPQVIRDDQFTFLDNGVVRLGIDLSRGGTLGWLGLSGTNMSLLNHHDFGREIQGSFYSGPNPYDPGGKCSEPGGWGQPWPWNPIGAGDVYNHAAPVINFTKSSDNTTATVFTQPMQWACDNVPCDCVFRQDIVLRGSAVEVSLTLLPHRTDTTFYAGVTQELPAVYVTGDFCHLWTYNSTLPPFTGAVTEQPAAWGANAWSTFTTSERWMAYTNSSGWGLGVVSAFVAQFGAGFYDSGKIGVYNCTPKGYGPDSDPTGYIAPWAAEIIDPFAPYTYTFALVLGHVAEIRAYAQSHASHPLVPTYDFVGTGSRAHCTYADATDGGLPVPPAGIAFNITGPHPTIYGPITVFQPALVTTVFVSATFDATAPAGAAAALVWRVLGQPNVCDGCAVTLPIVADGAPHVYAFRLAGHALYDSAPAITQIGFQPLGSAPVSARGVVCRVLSIASSAS